MLYLPAWCCANCAAAAREPGRSASRSAWASPCRAISRTHACCEFEPSNLQENRTICGYEGYLGSESCGAVHTRRRTWCGYIMHRALPFTSRTAICLTFCVLHLVTRFCLQAMPRRQEDSRQPPALPPTVDILDTLARLLEVRLLQPRCSFHYILR